MGMAAGVTMEEKFDLKKLLTSPFTGLYWTKVVMIGLGLIVLLFVGYAVYKAYVKKAEPSQRQETTITDPDLVQIDQRQIINNKETDALFLGVRLWRIKLGLSLLQQQQSQEKTETMLNKSP